MQPTKSELDFVLFMKFRNITFIGNFGNVELETYAHSTHKKFCIIFPFWNHDADEPGVVRGVRTQEFARGATNFFDLIFAK